MTLPDVPVALLIGGGVLLVAVIVAAFAVRAIAQGRRRMARSRQTVGMVTYSGMRGSGGNGDQPLTDLRISYQDHEGRTREGRWVSADRPFQMTIPVGTRLEVRYDPEHETWILPQDRFSPVVKGVTVLVVASVVGVVAAAFTWLFLGPLAWIDELGNANLP